MRGSNECNCLRLRENFADGSFLSLKGGRHGGKCHRKSLIDSHNLVILVPTLNNQLENGNARRACAFSDREEFGRVRAFRNCNFLKNQVEGNRRKLGAPKTQSSSRAN